MQTPTLDEWREALADCLAPLTAISETETQHNRALSRQRDEALCAVGRVLLQMAEHLEYKQWYPLLIDAGITPGDRRDYICIFQTSIYLHLEAQEKESEPMPTPAPFTQAAEGLMNLIDCNPNDREAIRIFLEAFAEHILMNTTPAVGSSIKKYQGLTIKQIMLALPDMESES
jgi:hypothetical protein